MKLRTNDEPDTSRDRNLIDRTSNKRGRYLLAGISLIFVLISLAAYFFFQFQKNRMEETQSAPPSLEALAQQFPRIRAILEDEKLGSVYKQFMLAYLEGGSEAALTLARQRGIINNNNEIRMSLELSSSDSRDLQVSLEDHGIKVTAVNGLMMDIAIPLDLLEASLESDEPGQIFMDISGLEQIIRIQLPIRAIEDVGSIETEGTAVIGSDKWNAVGLTGKGVKIGVLDVGFDGYKVLLGSDLPDSVQTQSFIYGMEIDGTGTQHGSAVAEIIHDVAPDAELIFACYQTDAEKQSAVDWLMSQGVDMISSSTGSIFGRRDGTGELAVMVDEVFTQDVLWVNSSGNTGNTHYRAVFSDRDGDGYHEFEPNDEYMGFSPIGGAALSLTWDDWDELRQDYDFFIYDSEGEEIASAVDAQNGPGSDAGEFIYYEFEDEGPYYMAIFAADVDRAVTFDFFLRDGIIEYFTPEYSVNTPGDSNSALTVGAINWESGVLEDYSSRGPTTDGRLKPELVAPAGVSSAAYGETWDGTSASCPHVSGAAALVMQAFPDYSAQQVKDFLIEHTIDLEDNGADFLTGYGALNLGEPPESFQILPTPLPAANQPTPNPSATPQAEPINAPLPTATPILEKDPVSLSADSDNKSLPLLMMLCIIIPGIFGVGGLGLLGVIVYIGKNKPKKPTPMNDYRVREIPERKKAEDEAGPETPCENICHKCGKVNHPSAHFCTKCGEALNLPMDVVQNEAPSLCTNCGNVLRPDAKFCPKCGAPARKE